MTLGQRFVSVRWHNWYFVRTRNKQLQYHNSVEIIYIFGSHTQIIIINTISQNEFTVSCNPRNGVVMVNIYEADKTILWILFSFRHIHDAQQEFLHFYTNWPVKKKQKSPQKTHSKNQSFHRPSSSCTAPHPLHVHSIVSALQSIAALPRIQPSYSPSFFLSTFARSVSALQGE